MLKNIREKQNLTQEELAEKSGISVRTIQRIEAGNHPKGYTLKILTKTLGIEEDALLHKKNTKKHIVENLIINKEPVLLNYKLIKLINLSSLPFAFLPPLNILLPLLLIATTKQKNYITKQLVSVQIMWTIISPIIFMLFIFMKLGNRFALVIMILIVLSNVFIILRNAIELDKKSKLYFKLNFNMI